MFNYFASAKNMRFIPTLKKPKPIRLAQLLRHQPALRRFFSRQPVELAFVFGSLAQDRLKALSDVDIAVLFRDNRYNLRMISKITSALASRLGREDIHLTILNEGSPVICMEVLHNGKLLYARSKNIFKQFRFKVIQRYLATQYLRKFFFQLVRKKILKKAAS